MDISFPIAFTTQLEFPKGNVPGYVCNHGSPRERDAASQVHTSGMPTRAMLHSWKLTPAARHVLLSILVMTSPAPDVWPSILTDYTYDSELDNADGVPHSVYDAASRSLGERLGYVCNPRSLNEGTETSRWRTDELESRLERPIHFECKLNEPMHIGMRLLHPAAADHSVNISRQQVQCIFRFSLRSRAGARPLSGGTGAVATGHDVSVPSFRERGLHT